MKGNRLKINDEALPEVEVKHHKHVVEVRFNFEEVPAHTIDIGDEQEEVPASFNYEYVKVNNLTKEDLKPAIIKTKYPTYDDELGAINDGLQDYQDLRTKADEVWNKINS